MKPTKAQTLFITAVLNLVKMSPELHRFAYGAGSGKTEGLKMLESEFHKLERRFPPTVNPHLTDEYNAQFKEET